MQRWCGYCLSGDTSGAESRVGAGATPGRARARCSSMMGCLLGEYAFTIPSDLLKAESVRRAARRRATPSHVRQAGGSRWCRSGQKDWMPRRGLPHGHHRRRRRWPPARSAASPSTSGRQFKVMVVANHLPAGVVSAPVLARLVPIPMDESHEHDPDPTLLQRLLDPGPMAAFAQWCLEGWHSVPERDRTRPICPKRAQSDAVRPSPAARPTRPVPTTTSSAGSTASSTGETTPALCCAMAEVHEQMTAGRSCTSAAARGETSPGGWRASSA